MAGTDITRCSNCGEGWYDRPDRVGTLCPNCWEIEQLELAAAEAQRIAEEAKARAVARRDEVRKDNAERETANQSVKASAKVPAAA